MALNVGVNVIEVDGRASPAIQAAPTSVAAFLGRTERGVPNQPVRIAGADRFRERFGGHLADGFLGFAVDGFFANGGRDAYVCRVAGAASVAAFVSLNNRLAAPTATLRLTAGYRGQADPGAWGNRLRVDVQDDPTATTTLAVATAANASSVQVVSIAGFRVGQVIRIVDQTPTPAVVQHRRIAAIDPVARTISWDAASPVAPILPLTTRVQGAEFRLIVRYREPRGAEAVVVEDWRSLSMDVGGSDYVVDILNHRFTGSRYLMVADLSGATAIGSELPAVARDVTLANGTDAAPAVADFVGSQADHTGLFAFDTAQIQLVAVPDAHSLGATDRALVVRGAIDYCAGRGDCMYVGSAPNRGASGGTVPRKLADYTETDAAYAQSIRNYSATFQGAKVFGALYAPWIQVLDPTFAGPAPTRFVPPDGHVMGVYARTDQERGVHKAPAGNAAQVRGALAVAATFTDGQHTDLVRSALVNGIRPQPGAGIVVAASRTLSTDTRWWFVNVRLLFNFVKSSLRDGLRFVRQEPHTEDLRRTVRLNVVRPFLMGLWRQGAFGSDPPDQVFTIKCDAENNPPNEVDLGNLRLEVYFYPVRPAETILIVVGQQPSGATAAEA